MYKVWHEQVIAKEELAFMIRIAFILLPFWMSTPVYTSLSLCKLFRTVTDVWAATPVASQDQLRSAPFCMGRCVVWTAVNCTTWPSGFAAWLKINGKPWAKRYDSYGMVLWRAITINHKSMAFSIIQYLLSENPSAMCWRDKIPKRHFT